MRRHYPVILLFLITLTLLNSCGVLLDPAKFDGVWQLESVSFFVYHEDLDSYEKITGVSDAVPTDTRPINGEFFGIAGQVTQLSMKSTTGIFSVDAAISDAITRWEVSTYDNSLTMKITGSRTSTNGLWEKGFSMTHYWPLYISAGLNYMELSVSAADINQDFITVSLSGGKTLQVKRISAVFLKIK
jgi:hypothetical protein